MDVAKGVAKEVAVEAQAGMGRPQAKGEGVKYSPAFLALDEVWNAETVDTLISNPRKWFPGTKRTFKGLANPDERAAVIAYLKTLKDETAL